MSTVELNEIFGFWVHLFSILRNDAVELWKMFSEIFFKCMRQDLGHVNKLFMLVYAFDLQKKKNYV